MPLGGPTRRIRSRARRRPPSLQLAVKPKVTHEKPTVYLLSGPISTSLPTCWRRYAKSRRGTLSPSNGSNADKSRPQGFLARRRSRGRQHHLTGAAAAIMLVDRRTQNEHDSLCGSSLSGKWLFCRRGALI